MGDDAHPPEKADYAATLSIVTSSEHEHHYHGHNIIFSIVVRNDGNMPLENLIIANRVPVNTSFFAVCQNKIKPSTSHEKAWWKMKQRMKFEADGWKYDPRYRQMRANENTF